jgi:hypothetical protein
MMAFFCSTRRVSMGNTPEAAQEKLSLNSSKGRGTKKKLITACATGGNSRHVIGLPDSRLFIVENVAQCRCRAPTSGEIAR